jgi:hypothetical protein
MTLLNLIERVQAKFPSAGNSWLLAEFNGAQTSFAFDTRCITRQASLTLTSALTYSLPSDLIAVKRVTVEDASGNPIDTLKWGLLVEKVSTVDTWRIQFVPWENRTASEMPSDVAAIKIEYAAYPTALASTASTIEIPAAFHEALFAEVMRRLSGMEGDMKAAMFWEHEYNKGVSRAKIDARMGKFAGIREIQPPADLIND